MNRNQHLLGDTAIAGRNASIDLLKVIAIFGVVYIHGSHLIAGSNSTTTFNEVKSLRSSFRFCVPVFIFLWAYFQEKSVIKYGINSLKKRFLQLFISFLFWSSIYFAFAVFQYDVGSQSIVSIISKYWTGYGWAGQYYFVILFQLIVLFPLVTKLVKLYINRLAILIIVLVSIIFYAVVAYSSLSDISILQKLNHRIFIYWLPYMILGIIQVHQDIFKIRTPIFFGIFMTVFIVMENYFTDFNGISDYLNPVVFIISLIILSSMNYDLSYEKLRPFPAKLIKTIANSTLGIFCLNPLIIKLYTLLFKNIGFQINFTGTSIIASLISTILIICTSLLAITFIKQIGLKYIVAN